MSSSMIMTMIGRRKKSGATAATTTWSKVTRHFSQSEGGNTYIVSDYEFESELENVFDPNHHRYLCCCGHAHSITGMKIIGGMLCITVLFELWKLVVTVLSIGVLQKVDVNDAAIRFIIGVFLAGSVVWAMWKERAEFLVPYLLLQGVGIAIILVFFVSFIYIVLFGDIKSGATVLRSYGFPVKSKDGSGYINYAAWLSVGSVAIILVLQIWLICINIACWRFFRDKRNMAAMIFPNRGILYENVNVGDDDDEEDEEEPKKMRTSMSATDFEEFKKREKEKSKKKSKEKEKARTRSFSAASEV